MFPGYLKSVQVRVAPAHDLLEKFVKQAEREVARHPDPAPHGRLDVGKGDRELVTGTPLGAVGVPARRCFGGLAMRRAHPRGVPQVLTTDRRL